MKSLNWLILLYLFFLCGCDYFEVYKKTEYVSDVTSILRKQRDISDNYLVLLNKALNKKISEEELKKNINLTKRAFIDNKIALEAIIPPKSYIKDHERFINAFQFCIDSTDISLKALSIKDEDVKNKEIKKAIEKIQEFKNSFHYQPILK